MERMDPIVAQIYRDTYLVNELGLSSYFVLVGAERALVIDAGGGFSDVKKIVASLTDKPYDVVITHSDGDHVFGAAQFDAVWIHPNDAPGIFPLDWSFMTDYLKSMNKTCKVCPLFGVTESWQYRTDKVPKLLPLCEGQLFDLGGGRVVETIEMFGHSEGQCVFLDRANRILFSGDACNTNLVLSVSNVALALRGLEKLKLREGEFDTNWNGHTGFIDDLRIRCVPPHIVDDLIVICKRILSGSAQFESFDWSATAGMGIKNQRARYGAAQVCLLPEDWGLSRN